MSYDPKDFKNDVIRLFIITLCCLLILFYAYTCKGEYQDPNAVIEEAMTHLGKPYRHYASGPDRFDCTGFTCYCFETVYGIELERSAKAQGYDDTYTKLPMNALRRGDLVYFDTNTHDNDLSDHAGIYMGDGNFIHCSSGRGKVIISSLWDGFYYEHFSWGRRVLQTGDEEKCN